MRSIVVCVALAIGAGCSIAYGITTAQSAIAGYEASPAFYTASDRARLAVLAASLAKADKPRRAKVARPGCHCLKWE